MISNRPRGAFETFGGNTAGGSRRSNTNPNGGIARHRNDQ